VDLLFLNNASTDRTYQIIEALRADHPFIYLITLSRNVGHQRSIECGLREAHGDLLIFIDVDCEDPPEMLPQFVALHEQGYDVVYGERVDREENRLAKFLRRVFYHIVKQVADEDVVLYMAEFCLVTSEVRDAALSGHDSFPFVRTMIARVGFNRIGIPYKRSRRVAGETHYNWANMAVYAVAGILASSTLLLRIPILLLPVWIAALLALGVLYLNSRQEWVLQAQLLVASTFVGATVAVIALYVARTYKNVLGRGNYAIHRRYSHFQPSSGAEQPQP
jgi:dolichol-phosphate mannosyltransferase